MAITGDNQYERGLFVNPDAIDARTKKWLGKLVGSVLKLAGEKNIVMELMVPNMLTPEMGTEGKFYDWGQLVARFKADGIPTDVQKIKPSETTYSLDEYEVKVGITDRAKINSQMGAQDLLTAGNAGKAFARAFDAQGLNIIKSDFNTTAGTNWSTESDANVMDQMDTIIGLVDDKGFDANAMVMTRKQKSRVTQIGLTYANPLTAEELIKTSNDGIKTIHIWKKIEIDEPDGSTTTLFDPTGYLAVIDTAACGVFTQRPLTIETKRDVDAGADYAYMRKYFKTDIVQPKAGRLLTGLVI